MEAPPECYLPPIKPIQLRFWILFLAPTVAEAIVRWLSYFTGNMYSSGPPTGSLNIVNSACVNCMLTTGVFFRYGFWQWGYHWIQYQRRSSTWSATIPTYQSSPINIIASVNGTNGCRSFTTFVELPILGVCIPPSQTFRFAIHCQ